MNGAFLKRHSSTIFAVIGGLGVIATTVTAIKDTPKAIKLLEEARDEKGEELTNMEKVKVAGPTYIPTIILGLSTLTCIFGSSVLNYKAQASLMSSYALLDSSYKKYKDKVKDIYGDDADENIVTEIAKDEYEENDISSDGETELFFDMKSMTYFEANMDDVLTKVVMDDGLECYIINNPLEDLWPF